jgi:glutamate-1-semialdehyde 2,1-aminomutase
MIERFEKSQAMQRRLNELIPGGCHTYAKGEDQFPEHMPIVVDRGDGCHTWDVDGNEYIEYGMGLRSVNLGHAYRPVVDAAHHAALRGNGFVRPTKLEAEVAEHLVNLIDSAEMVKFAKNGSDVNNAAVKLARAYTGRPLVAICRDHPFFSVDDWFIGTTPMNAGIPDEIKALTVSFSYNKIASVEALFAQHPNRIACLILEPEKNDPPRDNFLHEVQRVCRENGALFILDEMITGFRYHLKGAQALFGLDPDLSTFGKSIANGFALSALVGKREYMRLGDLYHDREKVFLLSTTHAAESPSLAAALETMRICERERVAEYLTHQGERLAAGVTKAAAAHRLQDHFGVLGRPCNLIYFTRNERGEPSQPFRTLFLQETIRRGLLMPSLVVSYSHRDADIDRTVEGIAEALHVYRRALDEGVEKYLIGRPVKPAVRKFN